MPKILTMLAGFPLNLRIRSGRTASCVLCLLTLAALFGGGLARAEKADGAQPLIFSADAARVDEARRLNILSGNVEITKGSMVVRADRVEVRQNAGGSQTAVASGGSGGRAYFRQKREGLNEFIEGEALRITYDGAADTVLFAGRAVMRRLSGSSTSDQVSGDTITYDNKTGVFQVSGSGSATQGPSPGRVQGVITPRGDGGPAQGR